MELLLNNIADVVQVMNVSVWCKINYFQWDSMGENNVSNLGMGPWSELTCPRWKVKVASI